ncbi:MAG: hypothetical protein ACI4GD_09885, partial [Lachnospiraceae bacterium]
ADREKIEYLQNEVNDTQSRLDKTQSQLDEARLTIEVYKLAKKGTPAYLIADSLQVLLKKVEMILSE